MVTLRNALKDNDALEQLKSDTQNDGVLRALLIRTCTDQAEFIITDYESGADAWRALKNEAEDDSPARRATITSMYNAVFLENTEPIDIQKHIAKLDNLARLLKATGCEINDGQKVNRLLASLLSNDYYVNFVKAQRRRNFTYQQLKQELMDDYYQFLHMFKELNRYSATQKAQNQVGDQFTRRQNRNLANVRFHPTSTSPPPALLNVKRKGGFKGRRLGGRCYNCNIFGHRAIDCRRQYGGASADFDKTKWRYTPQKVRDEQGNGEDSNSKRRKTYAMMLKTNIVEEINYSTSASKPLILDTGASDHVASDPEFITELSDFHEEVVSATHVVRVAQRCTARYELRNLTLVLRDALYIPTAEYNLVSVGKAIQNGSIPRFQNNGKVLKLTLSSGQTLIGRRNSSNLWRVQRIICQKPLL
ncbi:MAG: hypothetical protein AAGM67_00315, partial [Bacteroidota bacterium]